MRPSVVFAIVALVTTIYGEEEDGLRCDGGFCVSKALCPNGTYIASDTYAQEKAIVSLRLGDVDACSDYLLICCQSDDFNDSIEEPAPSEPWGSTCGKMNENGLLFELHSNETLAQYGEFPWVVYIFTTNETTSSGAFVCGGTLIHPLLVLTAAHNVLGKTNLIARFGEWDSGTDKERFPHQDIGVFNIIIHPKMVLNPIQNDLAFLVLKKKVEYRQHIQPICLPQPDAVFDGQRCISNGWGTTKGEYATIMKKLTLPVIPRAKCQRMLRFAGLGPFFQLREGFMCAGGEGTVDTCKGDGGGPLACQQHDGNFVLAGIVSWGIGCGGHNIPGVYTSITNYDSWITQTISEYDID